jgi:3-carboxy-cis,cis-muconate cycloisomerase
VTAAASHPVLSGLLGDAELALLLAAEADIAAMLRFEAALSAAEAAEGLIPAAAAEAIAAACTGFSPDTEALSAATARDGVAVPGLLQQLRQRLDPAHHPHLHFGATSQDAVDTALLLRLRPILDIFEARLVRMLAGFDELGARYGGHRLMGRTRMQEALPLTVADRLDAWRLPLRVHLDRLAELRPRLLVLQLGGPVGTFEQLGDRAGAVRRRVADALELGQGPQWHTRRDALAELAGWLSMVSGSLGKFGADIALMAQNALAEVRLAGGGTSSSMPHKANPVRAEVLVALARFNATLLPAMHQALLHEQERSGAAWTLEWLALPQMLVATGCSLRTAAELVGHLGEPGDG